MKSINIKNLILVVSAFLAITMLAGGSLLIFLIASNGRRQSAEEQTRVLVRSLSASLQNDLLSSNLFVASDRAKSVFSDELVRWTCFSIQSLPDLPNSEVLQIGNPVVCKDNAAEQNSEKIFFDRDKRHPAYLLKLKFTPSLMPLSLSVWTFVLPTAILLIALLSVFVLTTIFQHLFKAVNLLIRSEGRSETTFLNLNVSELENIQLILRELKDKRTLLVSAQLETERAITFHEVASQVSHDIRSPLSALFMATSNLQGLEEDRRSLIQNAVKRINDIANGLLSSGKGRALNATDTRTILLDSIIEQITSEKRNEYLERLDVKIEFIPNLTCGHFAKASPSDLARVLSNLINNAVEAKNGQHISVQIEVVESVSGSIIKIRDNGRGIPDDVLERLGDRGVSFGKDATEKGFGLGVHHAQQTLRQIGAQLKFQSEVDVGTLVQIAFPRVSTPIWFQDKVALNNRNMFVSVDDDPTIHQLWDAKLKSAGMNITHLRFDTLSDFSTWKSKQTARELDFALFVFDYEFRNEKKANGLQTVVDLGIAANSILVTSKFDHDEIQSEAIRAGIRIIPKSLLTQLPIVFTDRT